MITTVGHAVIVILVIGMTFIFPQTQLSDYHLQISAALFVILFLAKKFVIPRDPRSRLLESVVFTFIILSVVNTTGGVASPFFFLLYFLLFAQSLLLEPTIAIAVTVSLIGFFLMSLPPDQPFDAILPIFSLAFMAPFAHFLGHEYVTALKEKQMNSLLARKMIRDEEQTLLFLFLIMKNHITNIMDATDNFTGDHELDKIRKNAKRMDTLIQKYKDGQNS